GCISTYRAEWQLTHTARYSSRPAAIGSSGSKWGREMERTLFSACSVESVAPRLFDGEGAPRVQLMPNPTQTDTTQTLEAETTDEHRWTRILTIEQNESRRGSQS